MRPPIELPRTTVSPQVLEELLGEISSLASVYHKPADTFVGRGRIGAEAMQKRPIEYVLPAVSIPNSITNKARLFSSAEDDISREKALQTVVAGQQAENLLDFDDPSTGDGAAVGLAATTASIAATPAGAQFQTSSNPLDDLVSIFGSSGLSQSTAPPLSSGPPPLSALSFGGISSPASIMSPVQSTPKQTQNDDLLGLF